MCEKPDAGMDALPRIPSRDGLWVMKTRLVGRALKEKLGEPMGPAS